MTPNDLKESGLRLLEKSRKGLVHALFSRLGLFLVLLVMEVLLLLSAFRWFARLLPHFIGGAALFSAVMVLYLLNTRMDATAKITWLVIIMAAPGAGALLFWLVRSDLGHRAEKARVAELIDLTRGTLPPQPEALAALEKENPGAAALARYVDGNGCHPVYQNIEVTYFALGEEKWERLLAELEQAEKFIFLEYFIIDEGVMWGRVLEILARKAKAGVDVRVMYDGTCEFSTLPHDYPRRLAKLGIKCKAFAPVVPLVSTHYNYRDHRKILVIDGHTAFNGGVNLADEYINRIEKYGHWKDTAVMLKGEAARSFTLMFLQMWNVTEQPPKFGEFCAAPVPPVSAPGFVMPFGDCPLDEDKVGEQVYMDILNRATKYVHIMSPYLILDGELQNALEFAARRGVDVRLILPGVPDKTGPYALAKTHYAALLDAGVKIFEYDPGFVHAKVFVADGREAVVGTINLDYRSLYHHFECATWMYGVSCIGDIEADFEATQAKCRRVEKGTIWQNARRLRLLGPVLKVIAPLM
ncbi:phospholipase D-like domain-containing protein [Candidatus Allofournierella excrementavium]|uniref:phospholipase D-like domain-containing protein n=1 Tax=Candidatus Allofournierella excrementavium TaxID=2838591 RepID=UPI003AF650CC